MALALILTLRGFMFKAVSIDSASRSLFVLYFSSFLGFVKVMIAVLAWSYLTGASFFRASVSRGIFSPVSVFGLVFFMWSEKPKRLGSIGVLQINLIGI